jgi:hypothetical protein
MRASLPCSNVEICWFDSCWAVFRSVRPFQCREPSASEITSQFLNSRRLANDAPEENLPNCASGGQWRGCYRIVGGHAPGCRDGMVDRAGVRHEKSGNDRPSVPCGCHSRAPILCPSCIDSDGSAVISRVYALCCERCESPSEYHRSGCLLVPGILHGITSGVDGGGCLCAVCSPSRGGWRFVAASQWTSESHCISGAPPGPAEGQQGDLRPFPSETGTSPHPRLPRKSGLPLSVALSSRVATPQRVRPAVAMPRLSFPFFALHSS